AKGSAGARAGGVQNGAAWARDGEREGGTGDCEGGGQGDDGGEEEGDEEVGAEEDCGEAVKEMMENTALAPIEGKPVRSVNALLPIGVMLVGMVYGTLASGVEQHYLECVNAPLPIGVMLVGMVYGTLASGVEQHYLEPVRSVNALLPIGFMLVGMVYGKLASVVEQHYLEVGEGGPPPTAVLIWGSLLADAVAVLLAVAQRILTVEQCMDAWVTGIREVTLGLITLIHAWGVGNMSRQINVGGFVSSAVGEYLDPVLIAPCGFVLAAVVSLASGSSWGAMVLLFPILLPLSVDASARMGDTENHLLVECVAAVLSGAIVGDHISPISDTTVLAAVSSACPIHAHVVTQDDISGTTVLAAVSSACSIHAHVVTQVGFDL
ncbi:Na+/H+ antiporter family-domain-containing protein, partial [Baffinella frigidus]